MSRPRAALSAARARAHERLVTRVIWRTVVLAFGAALLLVGLSLLVLPGPGWPMIILGLVILATEYAWAKRMLDPIRAFAHRTAQRAMDPAHRKRNAVIGALLAVVALAVIIPALVWYVQHLGVGWPG